MPGAERGRGAVSPYSFLEHPSNEVAIQDASTGRAWTYRQLAQEIGSVARRLPAQRRELVFCFCRLAPEALVAYLGAVAADHAVALLDDNVDAELKRTLIELYKPRYIVTAGTDVQVEEGSSRAAPEVHPDLRLLLSTSGSTGSPKLVRLSDANVCGNAQSIVEYLQISPDERAIASLPIHYSYGLSVVHTHLAVGATVVFSGHSVLRPEFWHDFSARSCTSFAGVPYSYGMLRRIGFDRFELPSLRTMTQAGGAMAPETTIEFHEHLTRRDARLVVMYGQTEATARIAYLPPEWLPEKAGAIGVAIPEGKLEVFRDGQAVAQGETGELVYRGANVMLGYATGPTDLAEGDVMGGVLPTGDLGHRDADGCHFVTGRTKRIAKLFGMRVNLDEIEQTVRAISPCAVVGGEDEIVIFCVGITPEAHKDLRHTLAGRFRLTPRAIDVRGLDGLPLMGSGKVDYEALGELARAR
jgi:long-chain acyl-CoA synthetase